MRRTRTTVLCLSLLAAAAVPAAADVLPAPAGALPSSSSGSSSGGALATRDDAVATEEYFMSSDGVTRLHADVLRPKGLAPDARTPVVLTVSPYTNHNGSTTDMDLQGTGPNPRFYDFLDGTRALDEGYTYVMVDLPGFGGSGGCNDWGGQREQGAVRAAVEWAASQSWSNGKVALLGKSYDAWTGLMGVAQQPKGLAAVVSMEPVFSGYRYIWMNGVRRTSNAATVPLFQVIDAKPGRPGEPAYVANGAPNAWCYGVNMGGAALDDSPTGPYWAERDLGPTADGKTTPVFLMQGFLETNTKPDGAFAYWNDLDGEHNRAWFGQFDHVRGWEKTADGTREQTGRDVYFAELMRFLDQHLKGLEPEVEDPTVAVQDAKGRYRAEEQWPPADSRLFTTPLRTGSYTDDGTGRGLRPDPAGGDLWSISQPLEHDAWLSGEPVLTVGATSAPSANLAANVYDIAPDGTARMISRGVSLLRGVGTKTASYRLYGQDWPLEAGHRIGVRVGDADTDEFTHVATRRPVTVTSATVALPLLTQDRKRFLDSDGTTPRLEAYLGAAATRLTPAFIEANTVPFTLPGKLTGQPQG